MKISSLLSREGTKAEKGEGSAESHGASSGLSAAWLRGRVGGGSSPLHGSYILMGKRQLCLRKPLPGLIPMLMALLA